MSNFISKIASFGIGELCSGVGALAKDIRSAITGEISPEKKAEIESKVLELEVLGVQLSNEVTKMQSNVIIAEAQGESFLQRNWRPGLMSLFGLIIFNNYALYPYLSLFWNQAPILAIPDQMWDLLQLGVGGYIVGRSVEKGIKTWKEK